MSEMIGRPLAVVTGASSGIGRALAAQFAENGYDLVVAAEDDRIVPVARTLAPVPSTVQEVHLAAIHIVCAAVDAAVRGGIGPLLETAR